jgi:hypothetical protein
VAARVELFEAIRTDRRREQLSVRALAERHQVHRRTVRQALDSAVPPPRKSYPRSKPAIAPWTDIIAAWLQGDESVPRKQRHTARRIWQRLGAEHDAGLSEVTVSRYVGPGGANTATPGSRSSCLKPMSPVRRRRSTSASSTRSLPVSPRSAICSCCACPRRGKPRASRSPARARKRFSKDMSAPSLSWEAFRDGSATTI